MYLVLMVIDLLVSVFLPNCFKDNLKNEVLIAIVTVEPQIKKTTVNFHNSCHLQIMSLHKLSGQHFTIPKRMCKDKTT